MKKLVTLVTLVLAATGLTTGVTANASQAAPATVVTSYRCDSPYGGAATDVGFRGKLPTQVRSGAQVPARQIAFAVVLSEDWVDGLRRLGVESVSGEATGARVRVGAKAVPVRRIVLPRTDVPASGPMVLQGTGRMVSFTLTKVGTAVVRVPAAFDAEVVARTSSDTFALDFDCGLAAGARARIGAIEVVR